MIYITSERIKRHMEVVLIIFFYLRVNVKISANNYLLRIVLQ